MNGIISLKKHVNVDHFVIAKKIKEAIKMFLQLHQRLIIHTKIIYYNKILYVILYKYCYLVITIL
jgi:hypothetical protein